MGGEGPQQLPCTASHFMARRPCAAAAPTPLRLSTSCPARRRYRTAELFLKHPSKPPVVYSDAPLYQQLLRAYPEVKLQPLRLTSPQPSLAARFVGAQQAAIQAELAELQVAQQQAAQQQQQLGGLPPALQQQQQQYQRRPLQVMVEDAFRQVESRADIKQELQEAGCVLLLLLALVAYCSTRQAIMVVMTDRGSGKAVIVHTHTPRCSVRLRFCLPDRLPVLLIGWNCRSETRAGGYIELVQEQEEVVLQAALSKHAAQEAAASAAAAGKKG